MYDFGRGVSQDYIQAMKWFRKAAGQGDDEAQFELGSAYAEGQGVPQDMPRPSNGTARRLSRDSLPRNVNWEGFTPTVKACRRITSRR